jgi:hypothetical protein
MYVVINSVTYDKIKNLSFAPETDLSGCSLPVNEFVVDLFTDDAIALEQYASLYDDRGALWAKYWIMDVHRIDRQTVRVTARSITALLDQKVMAADLYAAGTTFGAAVAAVFSGVSSDYTVDTTLASVTVSGWGEKQTARERLQWLCFTAGAYVKSYFGGEIAILPIDSPRVLIPLADTYWKPRQEQKAVVTAVQVTAFTFTQGTPQTTDEYVTNGMEWYIVTRQDFTLTNPDAPSTAPENVVRVEDCMLVTPDNVATVMARLAVWYFNRREIRLEAIDNGDYYPGQKIYCYTDEESVEQGYVAEAVFSFGLQAKASLRVTVVEDRQAGNLTVNYQYNGATVGRAVYLLPVGYSYSISNPFVDWTANNNRYVFRPQNAAAEGTMVAGGVTDNQPYSVALHFNAGVLHVVSVSDLSVSGGSVHIG